MAEGFRLFKKNNTGETAALPGHLTANLGGLAANQNLSDACDDDKEHNEILRRAQSVVVDSEKLLAAAPELQKHQSKKPI